jgi:hypothetical protein
LVFTPLGQFDILKHVDDFRIFASQNFHKLSETCGDGEVTSVAKIAGVSAPRFHLGILDGE